MKTLALCLLAAGSLAQALHAAPAKPTTSRSPVVAPAPDVSFAAPGKTRSLRSLRGQAAVLLIARNADNGSFKKQLKELAPVYQEFASRGVVFIAAFTEEGDAIKSNIPFVVALNGPQVAANYRVDGKFQIAIIGRDGNIDYQTAKVLPGGRVRDVVQNSFAVQNESRKR